MEKECIREVVTALLTNDPEMIGETLERLPDPPSVEIKRMLFEASDVGKLSLGRNRKTGQFGILQTRFDPPLSFDRAAMILMNHLVEPNELERSYLR